MYRSLLWLLILLISGMWATSTFPTLGSICNDINDLIVDVDSFLSNWQESMVDSMPQQLQLSEVEMEEIFMRDYYEKLPVLMRNCSHSPVPSRDTFLRDFGDLSVKTGSESSIVYSNGRADVTMTLGELVETIERSDVCYYSSAGSADSTYCSSSQRDLFAFDVNLLKSIDATSQHTLFSTEDHSSAIFRGWYNETTVTSGWTYPVLSVGGVGSGLPFHTHGEAWLRVLSGTKLWLLIPPGGAPLSASEQRLWDPFVSTRTWLKNVFCPHHGTASSDSEECAVSPYIALQQAGDSIYVPAGWQHLTLNVRGSNATEAEAVVIAIGGQATWSAALRESVCTEALELNPNDYECLKSVGIGYLDRLKRIQRGRTAISDTVDGTLLTQGEELIRRAIAARPGFPDARLLLIEWLGVTGGSQLQQAESTATEAIYDSALDRLNARGGGEISARRGLATAYQRLAVAATSLAEEDTRRLVGKSLQLHPDNPTVLGLLLRLCVRAGDRTSALAALADIERVSPASTHIAKMREKVSSFRFHRQCFEHKDVVWGIIGYYEDKDQIMSPVIFDLECVNGGVEPWVPGFSSRGRSIGFLGFPKVPGFQPGLAFKFSIPRI